MTINQAKEMIIAKIQSKENQIKTRQQKIQEGKFETIVDMISFEIKNLQKDIEFLKLLLIELN